MKITSEGNNVLHMQHCNAGLACHMQHRLRIADALPCRSPSMSQTGDKTLLKPVHWSLASSQPEPWKGCGFCDHLYQPLNTCMAA
eukprot:1150273-Pelagomonas_calceolata.AAC.2